MSPTPLSCPILPVLPHLLLHQHAESLDGEIVAEYVFEIQYIAELAAYEAEESNLAFAVSSIQGETSRLLFLKPL